MACAGPGRARGFTLVEVLVALLVMALMAALAWRGLEGVLAGRDAGRASVDRSARLATLVAQWETDLQALQADAGVPALAFDGRTLRLVRRSGQALQLVAWTLDGTQWLRWASPPLTQLGALREAWLQSQQLRPGDAAVLPLLDDVQGWQLYFHRGNAWSNAQSSADFAAAAEDAASGAARSVELLPGGVRLLLQFVDGRTLTRDVLVVNGR
ncbi:MAG: hypothetical protein AMXMBFR78_25870 [Rubrivivax sp.]|jgi:general secretion pathway protein J